MRENSLSSGGGWWCYFVVRRWSASIREIHFFGTAKQLIAASVTGEGGGLSASHWRSLPPARSLLSQHLSWHVLARHCSCSHKHSLSMISGFITEYTCQSTTVLASASIGQANPRQSGSFILSQLHQHYPNTTLH